MEGIKQYQQINAYQESKSYAAYKEGKREPVAAKEKNAVQKVQDTYEKTDIMSTLSDEAKTLLEDLKEMYSNVDFFIGNYSTEEEAAGYLRQGKKEFSVLMTPQLLEEMAADSEVKEKYLTLLDDSLAQLKGMQEKLGEKGEEVSRLGVSISESGEVSFFADLEKMSENQRERIEKSREAKKEKAAEEKADKAEKEKSEKLQEAQKEKKAERTRLYATSVEVLLERIQNHEWKEEPVSRPSFDIKL